MSGFSKVMKDGWHAKGKSGGKESWRGDFKGINQVAGWMGKGKDSSSDPADHVSKPLSSLKDPASFGPPPKHTNYGDGAAVASPTTSSRQATEHQDQIYDQNAQAAAQEEEAAQQPAPPPVPYRANTTGLSTNNLPPPPVRRLDSPATNSPTAATSAKPKPQLPPRLPPRNGPPSDSPSPPPAYTPAPSSSSQGYVNQEAASRLSNAGVSVPALGVGEEDSRPAPTPSRTRDAAPVNELQSRFSQLRTNIASSPSAPSPPARTSPATMSAEPAADGGSSLQKFRERHADKIDSGKQKLGGVTSRVNTFVEDRKFSAQANKRIPRPPPAYGSSQPSAVPESPAARKKAPPPPPPKRADIRAAPVGAADVSPSSSSAAPTPPPVPMGTKPH